MTTPPLCAPACSPSCWARRSSQLVVIGSGIAAQTLSPATSGSSCSRTRPRPRPGCTRSSSCSARSPAGTSTPSCRFVDASFGGISWRDALAYIPAQVAGLRARRRSSPTDVLARRRSASPRTTAHSPAHLFSEIDRDRSGCCCVIFSLARTQPRQHDPGRGRRLHRRARTSSPARPASPTRRSASGACSPTRSPGSRPHRCPAYVVGAARRRCRARSSLMRSPLPRRHARRGRDARSPMPRGPPAAGPERG